VGHLPRMLSRTTLRLPRDNMKTDNTLPSDCRCRSGSDAAASTSAAAAQNFFGTPQLEMLRVLCQSMATDPSFSSDMGSTEASDERSHSHGSEPERSLQAALAALLHPAQQFLVRTTLPSVAAGQTCAPFSWRSHSSGVNIDAPTRPALLLHRLHAHRSSGASAMRSVPRRC
jgi:hypothetical protein